MRIFTTHFDPCLCSSATARGQDGAFEQWHLETLRLRRRDKGYEGQWGEQ